MDHPNQTDLERIRQTERRRDLVRKALTYMALALWALMVLFPFYWMLLNLSKKLRLLQRGAHTGALYPVTHPGKL